MKLRKYATSSPRKCLEEQNHELIMRHALDPDHSPLSPSQQEQYKRVVQAAKLFDDYPDERHVINLMTAYLRLGFVAHLGAQRPA